MRKNARKIKSIWDANIGKQLLLICISLLVWIEFKVGFSLPLQHLNLSPEDYKLWEFLSNNTDAFKDYYTSSEHRSLCPLPAQPRDVQNCNYPSCTSDDNCTDVKQICCFNGCVHTCQNHLSPPPILDWLEDLNNISSTNAIADDKDSVFTCSTTIRNLPARVRECPDGFKCHVYETGNPLTGSSNKGMCISEETTDPSEDTEIVRSSSTREIVYLPGGCLLTSNQYGDLENFLKHGHYVSCKCENGSVLCKVGYNSTLIS